MFPALGAHVLAFKSLGWSPAGLSVSEKNIGVPPMNKLLYTTQESGNVGLAFGQPLP